MVMGLKFYLKIVTFMLMTFFMPTAPFLLIVGIAIIGDTILGIWAAKKRGEKITSSKAGRMVPKMILYLAAILFGYMIDTFLVGEFLLKLFTIEMLMTKMITMCLLYIELLSIDENFERITSKNLMRSFKELISRASKVKEMK